MYLLLAIAAQLAEPQPETVTLGYEDLVALHKHADEVCPALFDDTASRDRSQRPIWNIMREHGYFGPKQVLLDIVCAQWRKGFGAGLRKGAAKP